MFHATQDNSPLLLTGTLVPVFIMAKQPVP